MEGHIKESNEKFSSYRFQYLSHVFKIVSEENDDVDLRIKAMTQKRICSNENCKKLYKDYIPGFSGAPLDGQAPAVNLMSSAAMYAYVFAKPRETRQKSCEI